ncbi:MAG: protein kinase domain-containing protein [Acidobacteriota bacterium]
MELSPGTRFGSYEIKHRLGAGGMGEVYFARDIKLSRHVAIKILLPEVTDDQDRVRRFKQEARATSALNHPNILTIFEVGETDSLHYLVTEFIDGVTLRQYLKKQKPPLDEMLDVSTQVAGALAAAHASAIIHRDIKPENIMRRADGYVKVLDFGLAKLLPSYGQGSADTELDTVVNLATDPKTIVGTVTYMSPEQLRGMEIDGQADIWSLGVVMYEMIAGRPPFDGSSKSDVIASILREEPPPLTRFADVPPELHRIIEKTLRKKREDRYQTARDLLIDLRDLNQDLALGKRMDRIRGTSSGAQSAGATVPFMSEARTERLTTSKIHTGRTTSAVASIMDEIKRHKVGATTGLALLAAILVFGAGWLAVRRFWPNVQPQPPQALQFTEIVTSSDVKEAAVSPDGKYVAAVVRDVGRESIIVQPVSTPTQPLKVVSGGEYRGLVFSRDGYSIYYLARGDQTQGLYQAALFGGTPRKLLDRVSTPITLSPDGNLLAFVGRKEGGTALMISNADGTGVRELAASPPNSQFGTVVNLNNGPAWSPDGKTIACSTMSSTEAQMKVVAVTVEDGSVRPIGTRKFFLVGQLGWIKDGTGLVMTAQEAMPPKSTPQIWFLEYPSGEARNLTNDRNYYYGISMTADSTSLISTRLSQTSQIWIVSDLLTHRVQALPGSRNKGFGGLAWTREGQIVYSSAESGVLEIWSMDVDGSNSRQLTFDRQTNVEPAVARDYPNSMVYVSYGKGTPNIWRMDVQARNGKQLSSGSYEDWPDVSPDGKWVVYAADDGSELRIWKVSIDGGEASRLTEKFARSPVFSPDGQKIACLMRAEAGWKLAVLPANGGTPETTYPIATTEAQQWHAPRWTPDGQAITYIVTRGGVSNIWSQPLSGGPARQLTKFDQDEIFAFAWSPDSEKLACVRGVNTMTAILISNIPQ